MEITDNLTTQMTETINIDIQKTSNSRIEEIDFDNIQFGKIFSDHMLVADYLDGEWTDVKIIPYGKLSLSPSISALNYGQAIFEGMKACKGTHNEVILFRPFDNFNRFNRSATRMSMPEVPEEIFMGGLTKLLNIDEQWVPPTDGSSLYLRPLMFATEEIIKVKPSNSYKFVILTCPVGPYYLEPIKLKIETKHSRACEGGVGNAKTAGNYAAAFYPRMIAQKEGYRQLIWTDAKEHKYIEEAGVMNILFVINGKLVTPSLDTGTILPGLTRDSVLTIAKDWGMTVEERRVTVDEVIEACQDGTLTEAFGTGTAATIAHISVIGYKGQDYTLPISESREFSNKVFEELEGIKRGKIKDTHDWVYPLG